jgi:hypothetical protein
MDTQTVIEDVERMLDGEDSEQYFDAELPTMCGGGGTGTGS